jgi:hypothetical protein
VAVGFSLIREARVVADRRLIFTGGLSLTLEIAVLVADRFIHGDGYDNDNDNDHYNDDQVVETEHTLLISHGDFHIESSVVLLIGIVPNACRSCCYIRQAD